jgi:pimeloyl-ACP methyl ester carboxylesterase
MRSLPHEAIIAGNGGTAKARALRRQLFTGTSRTSSRAPAADTAAARGSVSATGNRRHRPIGLVEDVEALRVYLGLERMDLLAHSAGAVLATMYTSVYPQRLSRLLLITPGLITVDHDEADAALAERSGEPWYAAARPAADAIMLGDRSMENYVASRPFYYGRWDEAAREHAAVGISPRNQAARDGFLRGVKPNVPLIREGLALLTAPVLLYVGGLDPFVTADAARSAAAEFGDAVVVVQPEAGHSPWIDDPAAFSAALAGFLGWCRVWQRLPRSFVTASTGTLVWPTRSRQPVLHGRVRFLLTLDARKVQDAPTRLIWRRSRPTCQVFSLAQNRVGGAAATFAHAESVFSVLVRSDCHRQTCVRAVR